MRNLPQNFIENAVSVFKRFTQNLPEDFEEKTQKIIEETKRKKARGANPVLKKLHEEGNTLFRTQEFEKAKKVYEDAINLIDFQSEEDSEDKRLGVTILSNLCLVYLKLNLDPNLVLETGNQAVYCIRNLQMQLTDDMTQDPDPTSDIVFKISIRQGTAYERLNKIKEAVFRYKGAKKGLKMKEKMIEALVFGAPKSLQEGNPMIPLLQKLRESMETARALKLNCLRSCSVDDYCVVLFGSKMIYPIERKQVDMQMWKPILSKTLVACCGCHINWETELEKSKKLQEFESMLSSWKRQILPTHLYISISFDNPENDFIETIKSKFDSELLHIFERKQKLSQFQHLKLLGEEISLENSKISKNLPENESNLEKLPNKNTVECVIFTNYCDIWHPKRAFEFWKSLKGLEAPGRLLKMEASNLFCPTYALSTSNPQNSEENFISSPEDVENSKKLKFFEVSKQNFSNPKASADNLCEICVSLQTLLDFTQKSDELLLRNKYCDSYFWKFCQMTEHGYSSLFYPSKTEQDEKSQKIGNWMYLRRSKPRIDELSVSEIMQQERFQEIVKKYNRFQKPEYFKGIFDLMSFYWGLHTELDRESFVSFLKFHKFPENYSKLFDEISYASKENAFSMLVKSPLFVSKSPKLNQTKEAEETQKQILKQMQSFSEFL